MSQSSPGKILESWEKTLQNGVGVHVINNAEEGLRLAFENGHSLIVIRYKKSSDNPANPGSSSMMHAPVGSDTKYSFEAKIGKTTLGMGLYRKVNLNC